MKHLMRLCTLTFFSAIVLFLTCNKGDDDFSPPKTYECLDGDWDEIIARWSDPVFISGDDTCVDTLCLIFDLDLRSDSTYTWDYLLFDPKADTLNVFEFHDEGTYLFDCKERSSFQRRFTYKTLNGDLTLISATEPVQTYHIRWDGFYEFQFGLQQLDIGLYGILYLR